MNTLPFLGTGYTGAPVQLTLQAGGAAPVINFGRLFKVEAISGGSRVWYRTTSESIGSYDVTETPTAIAAILPLILLTQVVPSGASTISYPAYYPIGILSEPQTSGTGATINIFHSSNAVPETITVSETKAAIIAAWQAAAIISGGGSGGSYGSITATGSTQGTAAAITTSVVRITGGAADTGVRLTTATGAEETFVHNATTKSKVVYPATGEFIDPSLVNQGFTIGPNEAVLFKCTLAGHWVTEIQVSNTQSVAASGTVQGGGQIKEGVTNAIITGVAFGNTAATLPAALPGARISVQQLAGSTAGRLYPAMGEQINAGGVNTFINMKADSTMELICNQAGLWVDAVSSVKNLVVDLIQARTSVGTITIENSLGTDVARFKSSGIEFPAPMNVSYLEGSAVAGGNQSSALSADANLVNVIVSATLGDAVRLSPLATTCTLTNNGAAACFVYCEIGGTINGVTNGYVIVAPGQTWYFDGQGLASPYAWTGSLLNSGPGEYTALAGVNRPHLIHPYATITTVATALDEVILDDQQQAVVLVNAGANTALLLPPSGGTLNGAASLEVPVRAIVHVQKTANNAWTATFQAYGVQSGTASTGSTQATGTKILSSSVNVTTCANAGDSYTIQFVTPKFFYFSNNGANSCDVFPPSSGTINGGAADAAISVAAGASYIFTSNDMFTWLAALQ